MFFLQLSDDPVYQNRHNLTADEIQEHIMNNIQEICELVQIRNLGEVCYENYILHQSISFSPPHRQNFCYASMGARRIFYKEAGQSPKRLP